MKAKKIIIIVFGVLLLSGCGQKTEIKATEKSAPIADVPAVSAPMTAEKAPDMSDVVPPPPPPPPMQVQ